MPFLLTLQVGKAYVSRRTQPEPGTRCGYGVVLSGFVPGGQMGTKLYVGNLPFSITSQELSDLFSQAGEVVSANIITDRFSGQSRGFGFVEMANEDSAQTAVSQFNDYQMKGRGLKVNEAKPREGGRGGGDRDRGGDRGG